MPDGIGDLVGERARRLLGVAIGRYTLGMSPNEVRKPTENEWIVLSEAMDETGYADVVDFLVDGSTGGDRETCEVTARFHKFVSLDGPAQIGLGTPLNIARWIEMQSLVDPAAAGR
ncbi:MAG: hypothetical protein EXR91_08175 [Gemmatimonadetes bacterium]|nr:hypothetical protein [Gemmatimonadota bacterium]